MAIEVGQRWNESTDCADPITLRRVIRLTSFGAYNQSPTYHTNTAFSADGKYVVFASARGKYSYIVRGDVDTGELTALYRAQGVGSRDYMHQSNENEPGNGEGVSGNRLALAPKSDWAIFTHNRSLKAVNIHTGDNRLLIEDIGQEWTYGAPSPSPDEEHVTVALSSAHPQILKDERVTKDYRSFPELKMKLLRVKMTGGQPEVLYEEQSCHCQHSSYCPTDNDIIYFDRNIIPGWFEGNVQKKIPRLWLIRVSTGETRPLREYDSYPGVYQVHAAWTWDGSAIAYHGFLKPKGYSSGIYIGITRKDGTNIRDYVFPDVCSYGHINPDPIRPALILDGDVAEGYLSWLYYDKEQPRLEIICRHNTAWGSLLGQYSHPHPQSNSAGNRICFNKAENGRTDIYVVKV